MSIDLFFLRTEDFASLFCFFYCTKNNWRVISLTNFPKLDFKTGHFYLKGSKSAEQEVVVSTTIKENSKISPSNTKFRSR